mmetsp:Transcript_7811/g.14030  ORF Transcript_7811/g.14030 Transcript_7811/m.14030 type:complete len:85 (-) Transcript_7811:190-444(-)
MEIHVHVEDMIERVKRNTAPGSLTDRRKYDLLHLFENGSSNTAEAAQQQRHHRSLDGYIRHAGVAAVSSQVVNGLLKEERDSQP